MSAPPRETERDRKQPLGTLALVGGATALLLTRTWLPAFGSTGRVAALALAAATVLAASLAVPARTDPARAHPALVLIVGLGAVVLALAVGGTPVPAPYATWALPLAVLAFVFQRRIVAGLTAGAVKG